MSRFAFAVLACFLGSATVAAAKCNPPPPGLTMDQWESACKLYIYRAYEHYGVGLNYDDFIGGLYGMYLNPTKTDYRGVMTPLKACAADQTKLCNSAGWQFSCVKDRWSTTPVSCNVQLPR